MIQLITTCQLGVGIKEIGNGLLMLSGVIGEMATELDPNIPDWDYPLYVNLGLMVDAKPVEGINKLIMGYRSTGSYFMSPEGRFYQHKDFIDFMAKKDSEDELFHLIIKPEMRPGTPMFFPKREPLLPINNNN